MEYGQFTLRGGRIGIERETLRTQPDGQLARSFHPRALGSAFSHPHITIDYGEALLELVTGARTSRRIVIPWFALAFIGVMLINSLIHLPPAVLDTITTLDNWLLAMAMAALGMTTHHSTLRQAGIKPLILGAIILVWLVVAGGALQTWLAG